MKSCRFIAVFLFLLSQMSWAGLIELKGNGVTAFTSSNPVGTYSSPIAFVTSFTIETDTPDSNSDSLQGLFLNAIKGGSVVLNSGHQYDLDLSAPDAGNVETNAVVGSAYAIGTVRFYLKFIDTLGDILTLRYFSHTDPAYEDAGFVDAGTSLHGLENNVSFEGGGEICISNCATSTIVNTTFHTVPVVATVPEPQPLMLLFLGVLGIVFRRLKNNSSNISNQ